MSNYLNMRQNFLLADFITSNTPAPLYDADLENFWTQKSNIFKLVVSANFFKYTILILLNFFFKNCQKYKQKIFVMKTDKKFLNISIK